MTAPIIRPNSPDEFFALQAALQLGQLDRFAECLLFLRSHGIAALAARVRDGRNHADGTLPFPTAPNPGTTRPLCVLGIKVERRHIAAALIRDFTPDRVEVRVLASQPEKAVAAAIRFATNAAAKFETAPLALEKPAGSLHTRRRTIATALFAALAKLERPIVEISCETLWKSFASPACRTQGQLRNAVRRCWPAVGKRQRNAALDASAIAIYAYVRANFEH